MGTNRVGRKTLKSVSISIETVLEQHVNTDVVNDASVWHLSQWYTHGFPEDFACKEKKSTSLSLAKAFVKYHGQTPVSSFTSEGISVATAYAEWIIHYCVYFEVKVVVDMLDQRNLSTGLQSISPLALVDFDRSIPYLSKCYAKRQNEFGVLKMVFRIENASKTFIQYTTTSSL